MKTIFRILAGLLSAYLFYLVYLMTKYPMPGYEHDSFLPSFSGIMGFVFMIFAIRGKVGTSENDRYNLDKTLSTEFWPSKKGWIYLGGVLLIGFGFLYYVLFVRVP